MSMPRAGSAAPLFVAGIKYVSIFEAGMETGISTVSFSKAIKKSGGEPCKIKRAIVVLDSWIKERRASINRKYAI